MASNSGKRSVPIADDSDKISDNWTREQCIEELRRVVALDPNRAVTRNYFRVHSRIREVVWNRVFGSFQEFKRGADILLSRHAHRMELDVAKHSGATAMRQMNAEKAGYEEKYLRPCNRRFQTIVHMTDVHDKNCDPFWRRVMIDAVARIQPEKVILGGDALDLPEFGKYSIDPRSWDVVGRIKWLHEFLAEIRKVAPDAEIVYVEGNHEYRLLRHLSEGTQGIRVVLSDLHGFTVPKLLGLDAYEVNYVSRSDLGTFTKRDIDKEIGRNYWIGYDCYLVHHFPGGQRMGLPGGHGHHHKHWSQQFFSPVFGVGEWHQLGCGHRRAATYCDGEQWGLGFMVAHVDTHKKRVCHEYCQVSDFAVLGGKFYQREEHEV